jgi:SAM-dependent methyltransferase
MFQLGRVVQPPRSSARDRDNPRRVSPTPRPPLPARDLARIRRTRRHPDRTQPDYAVLRVLVDELERALGRVEPPVTDVLDLFAATQPYRDLLPAHENYVSMDIDEHYGPQDVVSDEFLPFADDAFDLIVFTEGFHYVTEPERGAAELRRVLRPGGTLILTLPLVWEYDRRIVERRYTGPALAELFADWDEVSVGEIGGYTVAWATLSGRILRGLSEFGPSPVRRVGALMLPAASVVLNAIAALLSRLELRWHSGPFVLPMGLILVARRPGER